MSVLAADDSILNQQKYTVPNAAGITTLLITLC